MKVNGKEIIGDKFAYDTCHKIYIIEDSKDEEEAKEIGYDIYGIEKLEKTYKKSCSLRFINNWKLNKCYVPQFEENVKFEK